jgi:predicted permease
MPVATLTPVLAEHYDIDLDIVNTSIVLSTTLSMLTLPIVATLLG